MSALFGMLVYVAKRQNFLLPCFSGQLGASPSRAYHINGCLSMLTLKITTNYTTPSTGKLSVDRVKEHLRVSHDVDDELIEIYIRAACHYVTSRTGIALLPTTFVQRWDRFPDDSDDPLYLLASPLRSVTSLTYTDANGDSQTVSASTYTTVDGPPALIQLAADGLWPADYLFKRHGVVAATYAAGYDDASKVPASLIHAVWLIVGHWYENREASSDLNIKSLPLAVDTLLSINSHGWDAFQIED